MCEPRVADKTGNVNNTCGTAILLVEDDPETSHSLSTLLESSGYRVTVESTGAAAIATLEHLQPDLILLELMLPDTDGLVLTYTLKKITGAPIIILSVRHEQVDRVLSLNVGADDFIAKPFDVDELGARIETVLRRASQVPRRY
jgi:DNA-binding response OmpR family regulator